MTLIALVFGAVPLGRALPAGAAPLDIELFSVEGGEAARAQRLVFERPKSESALPLIVPARLQSSRSSDLSARRSSATGETASGRALDHHVTDAHVCTSARRAASIVSANSL